MLLKRQYAYNTSHIPVEFISLPTYGRYGPLFDHLAPQVKNNTWAEFGVMTGNSTRRLSQLLNKTGKLYLFDSWLGLPEEWDLGNGVIEKKGAFQCEKWRTTDSRLIFCDGWFKDSLPFSFREQLGLVHIDCDLYSSTRDALFGANEFILDGTIIVFDEIWGYKNYRNHEYKACKEWEQASGKRIEWLCKDTDFAAAGVVKIG